MKRAEASGSFRDAVVEPAVEQIELPAHLVEVLLRHDLLVLEHREEGLGEERDALQVALQLLTAVLELGNARVGAGGGARLRGSWPAPTRGLPRPARRTRPAGCRPGRGLYAGCAAPACGARVPGALRRSPRAWWRRAADGGRVGGRAAVRRGKRGRSGLSLDRLPCRVELRHRSDQPLQPIHSHRRPPAGVYRTTRTRREAAAPRMGRARGWARAPGRDAARRAVPGGKAIELCCAHLAPWRNGRRRGFKIRCQR